MKRLKHALAALDKRLLPPDDEMGRMNYAWLAYLGFLFLPLTWSWHGWRFLVSTLLSLTVFLPIYFWTLRLHGRRAWWAMGAMVLLSFALAPFNPSAFTYAVYAAAFAPVLGNVRTGALTIGAIVLISATGFLLIGLFWPFVIMGMVITTMVGASNLFFATVGEKNAALKLSQQEIRRLAGQAERERIARDLHDLLGHTMSVVIRKAELAGRLIADDPARAREEIVAVERVGREALEQVRQAVGGYRVPELASEAAAVKVALQTSGIEAQIDDPPPMSADIGAVLAMVLREAVTNVIRHSGARHAQVEFSRENGCWLMRVADDGRGGSCQAGNGIRGMRERLAGVGGTLEIEGGHGCRLTVLVPAAGEVT